MYTAVELAARKTHPDLVSGPNQPSIGHHMPVRRPGERVPALQDRERRERVQLTGGDLQPAAPILEKSPHPDVEPVRELL